MIVLVTGGRNFNDPAFISRHLHVIHAGEPITLLIEGGARGADRIARNWAENRGIPVRTFPADWDKYGRAAGHIRNTQMLEEGKPDLVVVFPGGAGTANMARQAEERREKGLRIRYAQL